MPKTRSGKIMRRVIAGISNVGERFVDEVSAKRSKMAGSFALA